MSALSDKGITLEGLAAAGDSLRQELATWKALAHKQDQLSADQITATQSGATAAKISQIAVNTAAIQSLAAQVAGQISLEYVTTLPATGEPLTLYLVPQGDGTAPNFCNEYLWVNNDWELIGTTGAMANNGELTIQVNGVTVGTFTANQAANSTVNITVPTNTNQLTNGAGFVDTAALQAALLLKQNNLTAVQLEAVNSGITAAAVQQIADNATAIAGKQDALTTAQQAAVDSGATAAKIDQIAANASAIVSLTSSKQDSLSTTQLAAVNSGITSAAVQQIGTNASNISGLQTAVASKAADNSVVHLAGAETITGDKTFTGAVVTHNITPETDNTYSLGSSSYQWAKIYGKEYYYNGTQWGLDKANTWTGVNTFSIATAESVAVKHTTYKGAILFKTNGVSSFKNYNTFFKWDISGYDNTFGLYRSVGVLGDTTTGATDEDIDTSFSLWKAHIRNKSLDFTDSVKVTNDGTGNSLKPITTNATDLGTSTNKWKTLNGINPGALSLPGTGGYTDIKGDITNLSGGNNTFTAPYDGWVCIKSTNATAIHIINTTWAVGQSATQSTAGSLCCLCPVMSGQSFHVIVKATSLEYAYIHPCKGNV